MILGRRCQLIERKGAPEYQPPGFFRHDGWPTASPPYLPNRLGYNAFVGLPSGPSWGERAKLPAYPGNSTGLSQPSLLTADTPKNQPSTMTFFNTTESASLAPCTCCHCGAVVSRHHAL